MRIIFTFLISFLLVGGTAFSQADGDYRSAVTSGLWETLATWQVFDDGNWVAATTIPDAGDGVITIQAGDSVVLTQTRTIDQVVVDNGGVLAFFHPNTPATITLGDGGNGDDIIVNGRLYIGLNGTLSGAGAVLVNPAGSLRITGGGHLAVTTDNTGEIQFSNGAFIDNTEVTNTGNMVWLSGTINCTNATFNNEGVFSVAVSAISQMMNVAPSTFNNTATGIVEHVGSAGAILNVPFSNSGTIRGNGEFLFSTVAENTGILAPGTSPGLLTLNPAMLNNRATEVVIEISTTGNVAGTDYDQLGVSSFPSPIFVSLTSATLTVTGQTDDPVSTEYTILTRVGASEFTGNFASTNIPSNYNISYTPTAVILTKMSILPLTWGSFTLGESNGSIVLNWSTVQESNTSHFVIEQSPDGKNYEPVRTLAAGGNTSGVTNYSFSYSPAVGQTSFFFRIKQLDLDGKSSYSPTRSIKLTSSRVIQVYPNPSYGILNFNVPENNSKIVLYDMTGRSVKTAIFGRGVQQLDISNLPAGVYQVAVINSDQLLFTRRIIKQ
ncbi:MAG: T9SS type A sorting domain-containing protein [Chitinophagaceae bacterium]|nr:T9SS type A sorting domain-containing protein [Chitinophagaceae bacterium]MCW5928541.1 T9SS type A sorting domain-containing protein [Chitinophagaceae bacterium]